MCQWEGKRHTPFTTLNITSYNVAVIETNPGFSAYQSSCQECNTATFKGDNLTVTASYNIVKSNKEPLRSADQLKDEHLEVYYPTRDTPLATEVNINGSTVSHDTLAKVTDDGDSSPYDDSVELLHLQQRFSHFSMTKLQKTTRHGTIPTRQAKCHVHTRTSCQFGKVTTPTKAKAYHTVAQPGQSVLVDLSISTTPGLIDTLRCKPATKRCKAAASFTDYNYTPHTETSKELATATVTPVTQVTQGTTAPGPEMPQQEGAPQGNAPKKPTSYNLGKDIHPIKTTDQPAEVLTKALPQEPFEKHSNMGLKHSVDEREYGNNKEQRRRELLHNSSLDGSLASHNGSLISTQAMALKPRPLYINP